MQTIRASALSTLALEDTNQILPLIRGVALRVLALTPSDCQRHRILAVIAQWGKGTNAEFL